MKLCRGCQTEKPETEFWARPSRPCGLQSRCKSCTTARGRKSRQRYRKTEKGKLADRKYVQSDAYKAQRKNWLAKLTPAERRSYRERWAEKNREHALMLHRASMAVQRALKDGRLVRPAQCSKCGAEGKPQAHHHIGYAKEHHLDVIWVCRSCHEREHEGPTGHVARWDGAGFGSEPVA